MLISQAFLERTLHLRSAFGTASGCYCEFDGTPLILTAGHLMQGVSEGEKIYVKQNGAWHFITVKKIGFCIQGSDVCAIIPDQKWGEGLPESWMSQGLILGQDVRYTGFPLSINIKGVDESPFPIPLIKSGIFSGAEQRDGWMMYLIDTVNNFGFSGGPVLAVDVKTEKVAVAAIVSGFLYDAPQFLNSKGGNGEVHVSDTQYVLPNSGFMRAVPIALALAVAKSLI